MNVAPVRTIILGLQIVSDHKSLSSKDLADTGKSHEKLPLFFGTLPLGNQNISGVNPFNCQSTNLVILYSMKILLMTFSARGKMKANPFCLKLKQTSKKRYFNYFERVFHTSQFINQAGQGGRKKSVFTVRLTIRGRGGQPPWS